MRFQTNWYLIKSSGIIHHCTTVKHYYLIILHKGFCIEKHAGLSWKHKKRKMEKKGGVEKPGNREKSGWGRHMKK